MVELQMLHVPRAGISPAVEPTSPIKGSLPWWRRVTTASSPSRQLCLVELLRVPVSPHLRVSLHPAKLAWSSTSSPSRQLCLIKLLRVPVSPHLRVSLHPAKLAWWSTRLLLGFFVLLPLLTSCGGGSTTTTSSPTATNAQASSTSTEKVQVVAAENFWGSIASQIGGDRVQITSIITNPATDPHDYEPKPTDARTIANARYVILNGAGYDPWGQKLLEANPVNGRKVLNVGDLVGKKQGDNPHLWYSPEYVMRVVDQITADLKNLDQADATYFDQQRKQFVTLGLKDYNDTINTIKQKYQGTPIGSTESIFAYQSQPLGLNLITPPKFMSAISEGQAPTASDKATFDKQITQKQIKVLVFNSQNSTPDTNALKQKAQTVGIPIVPITETLTPATATFQEWQVGQLKALQQALAKSTGK